jgi:menaquinone-9 beta-reductase
MSVSRRENIVIVGGGPAGAASAVGLAKRGLASLVIERDSEPRHKICGEFISIEAQRYLAAMGVDLAVLGGVRIGKVRLVSDRGYAETALPFEGIGLTRRALDEAVLQQAKASGANIRRGAIASAIALDGPGFEIRMRDDAAIRADTVFLATGKHDLQFPKRPAGRSGDDLIGFKTYWTLAPEQRTALDHAVEIILLKGGYAGLQCVEAGQVNLCLLVKRAIFDESGRTWAGLLEHLLIESPHLRRRLSGAEQLQGRPLTIARVPYGYLHCPDPAEAQKLFRLGDQMGVIPSFCGDGIAMALHTGLLAASVFAELGPAASEYHRRARNDMKRPIRLASRLYDISCRRIGREAVVAACRLYPGILGTLASWTRVPTQAPFELT